MPQLMALALSVGVLGGIAAFLFLSFPGLLIWAFFIAAASFFYAGGNVTALRNTIVSSVFGSIMGWLAAVIILAIPLAATLTLPVWAGLVVTITAFVLICAARIPALSVIPANVLGYATAFGYLLQTPDALTLSNLQSLGLNNVVITVSISMALGAI